MESTVNSTIWLVGGETSDLEFMQDDLVSKGYNILAFPCGDDCLEHLFSSRKSPDMIIVLGELSADMASAERIESQVSFVELDLPTVRLTKIQIFALRQRAYAYQHDKLDTLPKEEEEETNYSCNPALKRLTDELKKLSAGQ